MDNLHTTDTKHDRTARGTGDTPSSGTGPGPCRQGSAGCWALDDGHVATVALGRRIGQAQHGVAPGDTLAEERQTASFDLARDLNERRRDGACNGDRHGAGCPGDRPTTPSIGFMGSRLHRHSRAPARDGGRTRRFAPRSQWQVPRPPVATLRDSPSGGCARWSRARRPGTQADGRPDLSDKPRSSVTGVNESLVRVLTHSPPRATRHSTS